MKRLLVLCDLLAHRGGTESYLARVLLGLQEAGVGVTLLARSILDASAFGVDAHEIAWGGDTEPPNLDAAVRVGRVLNVLRPDAVMLSNVFDRCVVHAARLAPRLIVRVHDHRLFCPQGDRFFPHFPQSCMRPMGNGCLTNAALRGCAAGLHEKTLQLLRSKEALKKALLSADHFFVASRFMAQLCLVNGVPMAQIAIAPPPISGEPVEEPAPPPWKPRVFFGGRLVPNKGLLSLLRALARIPSRMRPELAVAGAPTRESQCLPFLAERLGVELTMLGYLDARSMDQEIDASTLVAVPSLWPEPFGMMGIEAQARGRPVVAYAVGGIAEWIADAGIAVRAGDEGALADAILRAIDAEYWPTFANAAIRQARRYTLHTHLRSLTPLLGFSLEKMIYSGA